MTDCKMNAFVKLYLVFFCPASYARLFVTAQADTNMSSLYPDGNFSDAEYDAYMHYMCANQWTSYPEYVAARSLETFLYPFLLLLATIGNVLSLLAFRHLVATTWSTCFYLHVLCVVDLVVLYIKCGGTWYRKVADSDLSERIMRFSDAMCKTYIFVFNVLLQLWPWLTVALCVELTIATRCPLKTYVMCTWERARAILLLITILLVCLNLNFFWTWGKIDSGGCIYIEEFSTEFMNVIWPSIVMGVEHVLPLLAATVCFFVTTISLLRSSRAQVSRYERVLQNYFLDLQALQQLKHAALVVVLLFLVVKTFTVSYEILNFLDIRGVLRVPCQQLGHFMAKKYLLSVLRDTVLYCYLSLKFCVYFGFCASFRKQCYAHARRILCVCKKSKYAVGGESNRRLLSGNDKFSRSNEVATGNDGVVRLCATSSLITQDATPITTKV